MSSASRRSLSRVTPDKPYLFVSIVKPLRYSAAFTLIELMVTMALAIFFVLATMAIADISTQSYRAQERVSDAQQGARAALELMVRDIRMAGYDPMALSNGRTSGAGILSASETSIHFVADLNADGRDSGGIENMTYFYDAANQRLRQEEGGAYPQTIIENVSHLRFTYLDSRGNAPSSIDDITVVLVTLTITDRDHKGDAFQRTLTTRINCRNLRL